MPPASAAPYSQFNFLVEVEGVTVGGFSECSGLGNDTGTIEYRDGGDNNFGTKLPGLRESSRIILKRGIVAMELWEWHKTFVRARTQRRDGTITVLNEAGEAVLRFKFHAGWPSKLEGPALDADADQVTVETLEISHEGLEHLESG